MVLGEYVGGYGLGSKRSAFLAVAVAVTAAILLALISRRVTDTDELWLLWEIVYISDY